jgi:prevent-host-death family protein
MISIPLAQAKNQLSELISKVEAGETVSVTRRGRPVARLVRCSDDSTGAQGEQVQQALLTLRRLRQGICLEGDIQEIAREGLA